MREVGMGGAKKRDGGKREMGTVPGRRSGEGVRGALRNIQRKVKGIIGN